MDLSFKEMFNQNESKAEMGDWEGGELVLDYTDKEFHYKKSILIDKLDIGGKEMKLMQYRNSGKYMLGYDETLIIDTKNGEEEVEKFANVLYIDFEKQASLGHNLGNNKLYRVKEVAVSNKKDMQSKGIATAVYKYFVQKKGWELLSDSHYCIGRCKLWDAISRECSIKIDLVDINEDKYIKQNITVHYEDYNEKLKQTIPNGDNIRAILTNIVSHI